MLDEIAEEGPAEGLTDLKRAAYEFMTDAMDEAESDGIEREIVVQAALFAALTDLVGRYGEDAVAEFARGLAPRVEKGEFTICRTLQ